MLVQPDALGERDELRPPPAVRVGHMMVRVSHEEERDVHQLGEDGEWSCQRPLDGHREVACAVRGLDLALDQLRRTAVDIRRGERDAPDRREPGSTDAQCAGFERRPQRALEVAALRPELHQCIDLRVRDT